MAPRPTWKGFLRLSLVTVPVRAFGAANPANEVRLNQLHADCHNRIKYLKSCPEHGTVSNEQIVNGYEYAKGQYVVIDLDELSKLRPESDKTIRIDGFVAAGTVNPLYLSGRTYYLLPEGVVGQKPYALLFRAMVESRVHAIAQVVLSGREQLVLLEPLDRVVAMRILHHESEIKLPAELHDELVEQQVSEVELQLTKTLVEASRIASFDYASYEDSYVTRLTRLIEAKVEGQELVQVADPEEPKILNLMDALKQSVARAKLG